MRKSVLALTIIAALISLSSNLQAHCQIPCGIYNDHLRIKLMSEHVTTIEKSMKFIDKLSQDPVQNTNQIVRWVNNKDDHADQLTEIVTSYFLSQRIKIKNMDDKAAFADYQKKLTLFHKIMVFAMKAKQTTDLKNTEKLSSLIDKFSKVYFTEKNKKHLEGHKK